MNEPQRQERDPRFETLVFLTAIACIAFFFFTDSWTTRDDLLTATADVVSMQKNGNITDCRTGERLPNPDLARSKNVTLTLEFTDASGTRHSTSYAKDLLDLTAKSRCKPGAKINIRYDPADTSVVFPASDSSRNTALFAAFVGAAALVGIVVTLVRKPAS